MNNFSTNPCILFVTPAVNCLPEGMGDLFTRVRTGGGGVADFSATLVRALFDQGVNIHVAMPDYRRIYNRQLSPNAKREPATIRNQEAEESIHLAKDRSLFYVDQITGYRVMTKQFFRI